MFLRNTLIAATVAASALIPQQQQEKTVDVHWVHNHNVAQIQQCCAAKNPGGTPADQHFGYLGPDASYIIDEDGTPGGYWLDEHLNTLDCDDNPCIWNGGIAAYDYSKLDADYATAKGPGWEAAGYDGTDSGIAQYDYDYGLPITGYGIDESKVYDHSHPYGWKAAQH